MSKNITIIFSGLSIENTPKLLQVKKSLEKDGHKVSIKGIVKSSVHKNQSGLYIKGNSQGILKILQVLILQFRLITHLIFTDKADFYYSVNTISGLIAYLVTRINKKKYIYEAHEMVFGLNYPFFRGRWRLIWNRIEKVVINHSSFFLTTDKFRLQFYRRYLKINLGDCGYILNVPEKITFESKKTLRKKYQIDLSKKILSYCGGVIPGRNIEEIIEAYSHLNHQETNLIIAGSIDKEYLHELRQLCSRLSIENNVTFTGQLDNHSLKEYMALSDLTYILYQPTSLNNRFSSPNKIFDAIHCETYFIATESPLAQDLLKTNEVGTIINEVCIEELERTTKNALHEIANQARIDYSSVKNYYCWENESKKIKDIVDNIS